jgi:hypothetical protein
MRLGVATEAPPAGKRSAQSRLCRGRQERRGRGWRRGTPGRESCCRWVGHTWQGHMRRGREPSDSCPLTQPLHGRHKLVMKLGGPPQTLCRAIGLCNRPWGGGAAARARVAPDGRRTPWGASSCAVPALRAGQAAAVTHRRRRPRTWRGLCRWLRAAGSAPLPRGHGLGGGAGGGIGGRAWAGPGSGVA